VWKASTHSATMIQHSQVLLFSFALVLVISNDLQVANALFGPASPWYTFHGFLINDIIPIESPDLVLVDMSGSKNTSLALVKATANGFSTITQMQLPVDICSPQFLPFNQSTVLLICSDSKSVHGPPRWTFFGLVTVKGLSITLPNRMVVL